MEPNSDAKPTPGRARRAQARRQLPKSGKTRQKILDAAARSFATKGYGRTFLTDISAEVGIHVSALYYHFDTKEALAEAVLAHVATMGQRTSDAVASSPHSGSFEDRLRVAVRAQLLGVIDERDYIAAQLKILSELPEDIQARHRAVLRESMEFWRVLFADAVDAKAIRPSFDPGIVRMTLIGSLNWAVEWFRDDGLPKEEIAEQISQMILYGLTVPRPASSGFK